MVEQVTALKMGNN